MGVEKTPKVSVCVVTYNQEKYIRQCLQSIVDQKTNFEYEVLVGDDCSTDGTRAIVQEFAANYPLIVKPIFNEVNIGPYKNLIFVHGKAVGQFIAHIDGDDFMLPGKLMIQAEELDKNKDCAICFHAVKNFDQHEQRYRKIKLKEIPRKSDINYLIMNLSLFSHSSKMYRSECRNGLNFVTEETMDSYLHLHHALTGKILFLNDVLGVYRLNVGIYSENNKIGSIYNVPNEKIIKLVFDAIEYAGRSGVEVSLINKAKAKTYFNYSYYYLLANDIDNFKLFINKSHETAKLSNVQYLFKYFSNIPIILFFMVRMRLFLKKKYEN